MEATLAVNHEAVFWQFMALYKRGERLPEMVHRLCRFVKWTDLGLCFIRDQASEIVPLHLNRIQRILIGAAMLQAAQGKPIRIVDGKARKGGSSTLWQALLVFLGGHFQNQVALMLAHVPDSTTELFEIARTIVRHYPANSVPLSTTIKFPNTNSRYTCHTAAGENVGAGGTPSLLHLSEVALYGRNKLDTMTSAMKSVPNETTTIVVLESTFRGREEFWDLFDDARKDSDHPYTSVFIPWFLDERLVLEPDDGMEPTEDEVLIYRIARNQYGIELGPEAFAWRRNEIKATVGGLAVFRREYPSTPEEAVQGSSDLILPGMRECVIQQLPFEYTSLEWELLSGGMDYGFHDPTVLLAGAYVDQVLYVVTMYRASGKLAADHVYQVMDGTTYYCDPSAVEGREEMMAEINRRNRPVKMIAAPRRKNARSAGFVDDEWQMVQRMMAEGRLKILEQASEQLLLEADNLSWNSRTGKPDDTRGATWGHFDTLNALRYWVMGVDRHCEVEAVVVGRDRKRSRRMEFRL